MTEFGRRFKPQAFLTGALLGALIGLCAKDLQLEMLVSYWGDASTLVLWTTLLGGLVGLSPIGDALKAVASTAGIVWLAVAFTPLTHWMAQGLIREDPLRNADAVFVLASGLQEDGGLTENSMSRLVGGLAVLGEGWAPTLILSELPAGRPRYERTAREMMTRLGLDHDILSVGPVQNTRDEAVAVGALYLERGFERLVVVTSPSHSRRAAAALESAGVEVISRPSAETVYDIENLNQFTGGDDHIEAFGPLAHEWIGLHYYRLRGWIK